jgi:ferric-dicitrate binding protein FerR (iron transport regulator)
MDIELYLQFTAADFIEDEYFRLWVLRPEAETRSFWEGFLDNHPEMTAEVEAAKHLLQSLHRHFEDEVRQVSEQQTEASFQVLSRKLPSSTEAHPSSRPHRRLLPYAAAAALLLLVGIGFATFLTNEERAVTFATGNGKRLPLELPDGSKVQLNANSALMYHKKDWADNGNRQVWLEGEAWFDVRKKKDGARFTVHSGDLTIQVLGTQFNVRSRGAESEVVLAEGKVTLDVADQRITMQPGDLVSYSKERQRVESKRVKTADYVAWKDGITVFNATLSEVARELEFTYGLRFIINNEKLKNRKIRLSVPTHDLDQVLETLRLLYPNEIRIEKSEEEVVIS